MTWHDGAEMGVHDPVSFYAVQEYPRKEESLRNRIEL
jgi:hypothetical protein